MKKIALALIAAVLFAMTASPATYAASIEVSKTVKTAFNKTAAAADITMRSKLTTQYAEFAASQEQDRKWDDTIKSLHYKNEEALTVLRQQIKQIDADKLNKLEDAVKQTRERYQPLFDLYRVIRTQSMKAAVQLARIDIQIKEHAWASAKDKVKKTVAKIRETLAGIDTVNVQIKAERSGVKSPAVQLSEEWKSFTQYVKKSDATNVSNVLTALNSLSKQITYKKQNIYNLESKIGTIIQKAKGQMP